MSQNNTVENNNWVDDSSAFNLNCSKLLAEISVNNSQINTDNNKIMNTTEDDEFYFEKLMLKELDNQLSKKEAKEEPQTPK